MSRWCCILLLYTAVVNIRWQVITFTHIEQLRPRTGRSQLVINIFDIYYSSCSVRALHVIVWIENDIAVIFKIISLLADHLCILWSRSKPLIFIWGRLVLNIFVQLFLHPESLLHPCIIRIWLLTAATTTVTISLWDAKVLANIESSLFLFDLRWEFRMWDELLFSFITIKARFHLYHHSLMIIIFWFPRRPADLIRQCLGVF